MLEEYPAIKEKLLKYYGYNIDKEPFFKGSKEKWRECRKAWESLSREELEELERELPGAERFTSGNKKEFHSNTLFTKNFLVTDSRILSSGVWPVRYKDMLWAYNYIFTQRMNFIPTIVNVYVYMYDRDGKQYDLLGCSSKVFHSEHDELVGALRALKERVKTIRPGLLTGYSKDWDTQRAKDFPAFVRMCDELNERLLRETPQPETQRQTGSAQSQQAQPKNNSGPSRTIAGGLGGSGKNQKVVTEHSFWIAAEDSEEGVCIISNRTTIPCSQSLVFQTVDDYQEDIIFKICEGDSDRMSDNTDLGLYRISGFDLVPAGQTAVRITVSIDRLKKIPKIAAIEEKSGRTLKVERYQD